VRLNFCVACGEDDVCKLEHHHLVPKAEGGSDEDSNRVTLCYACHGRVHCVLRRDVRDLARKGRERARVAGVKMGRPHKLTHYQQMEALARRDAGETLESIALSYAVSHPTIMRLRRRGITPERAA